MSRDDFDNGITVIRTVISLRCPLSLQRIVLPARGPHCIHARCFDAQVFLKLALEYCVDSMCCPICGGNISMDSLLIDEVRCCVLFVCLDVYKINGIWRLS